MILCHDEFLFTIELCVKFEFVQCVFLFFPLRIQPDGYVLFRDYATGDLAQVGYVKVTFSSWCHKQLLFLLLCAININVYSH